MNNAELIAEIARRSKRTRIQLSRKEVEAVFGHLFDVLGEELTRPEGRWVVPNFGTFEVRQRVQRGSQGRLKVGHNNAVRQRVSRMNYYLRFNPSKALRRQIRANTVRQASGKRKT